MRLLLAGLLAGVVAYVVLIGFLVLGDGLGVGVLPVMSVEDVRTVAFVALPANIFPLALGVPMIVLIVRGRRKKKAEKAKASALRRRFHRRRKAIEEANRRPPRTGARPVAPGGITWPFG